MFDVVMIGRCNAVRRVIVSELWASLVVCLFQLPETLGAAGHTRWTTNYYNVTGSTIREIRHSMQRNRPAKVTLDALTEWSIRSRFGTASLLGEYRCSGFTTTTTIRMTLPRWIPPEGVSDSVKQEWERYITLLTQHEVGHGQIAAAAAGELHRRVAAVGTDPDPDSLRSTVESVVQKTLQEFHERDRLYDRLTRHGLEQGASLGARNEGAGGESFTRGKRRMRERRQGATQMER